MRKESKIYSVIPISKYGDIWQLGRHRLMCGDSTSFEDVAKLMDNSHLDICLTSPPYGLSDPAFRNHYEKGKTRMKSLYNKKEKTFKKWYAMMSESFCNTKMYTDVQFINIQMLADNKRLLIKWLNDNMETFVDVIVWNKHTCPPQFHPNILNNAFEFVFIFDNENNSRIILYGNFKGTISNYIETKKEINKFSNIHRAVYSIEFARRILEINSKAKSVYDPFGGTGTTLIACEQFDRTCYMMDIEPIYIDTTIKRWETLIGEKAVLLNRLNR